MLMKNLKNTDLNLSSICLGIDDFGSTVEKKRAFDVMDAYHENGGNVLDTARVYGKGMSEKTLGEWIEERSVRNQIIISSKCGHPRLETMNISRLSKQEMEADIDQSLLTLAVDYIDIMWLHRDDINKPVSEIMDILSQITKKGKVRYFGVSNWYTHRIDEANQFAKEHSMAPLIASQIKWSYAITNPQFEDDPTLVEMNQTELTFYQKNGLPVFAYAPQAKGFFSKYNKGGEAELSQKAAERYHCDENIRRYESAKKLSNELGVPISAVVLSYITSRKDINAFAIVGCKNTDQLRDSISYADLILSKEQLDYLDK